MKIAVVSDIHGNVPALQAVLEDIEHWGPDELIVNGDLVSRGPYSLACLRLLQAQSAPAHYLRGNHEDLVLACADGGPDPEDPTFDLRRFAHWTAEQLGDALEDLRGWGEHIDLTALEGGASVHVTHGSRLGNRDGIFPETDDEALRRKLGDPRDLFIASHTHKPLLRPFGDTLVVNVGSVGQPFDQDPRAAYGRFAFRRGRWRAEIKRIAFDRAQALRDLEDSGFLDAGGPVTRLIRHELQHTRMQVGKWAVRYLPAVKAGEISVAASVDAYLDSL